MHVLNARLNFNNGSLHIYFNEIFQKMNLHIENVIRQMHFIANTIITIFTGQAKLCSFESLIADIGKNEFSYQSYLILWLTSTNLRKNTFKEKFSSTNYNMEIEMEDSCYRKTKINGNDNILLNNKIINDNEILENMDTNENNNSNNSYSKISNKINSNGTNNCNDSNYNYANIDSNIHNITNDNNSNDNDSDSNDNNKNNKYKNFENNKESKNNNGEYYSNDNEDNNSENNDNNHNNDNCNDYKNNENNDNNNNDSNNSNNNSNNESNNNSNNNNNNNGDNNNGNNNNCSNTNDDNDNGSNNNDDDGNSSNSNDNNYNNNSSSNNENVINYSYNSNISSNSDNNIDKNDNNYNSDSNINSNDNDDINIDSSDSDNADDNDSNNNNDNNSIDKGSKDNRTIGNMAHHSYFMPGKIFGNYQPQFRNFHPIYPLFQNNLQESNLKFSIDNILKDDFGKRVSDHFTKVNLERNYDYDLSNRKSHQRPLESFKKKIDKNDLTNSISTPLNKFISSTLGNVRATYSNLMGTREKNSNQESNALILPQINLAKDNASSSSNDKLKSISEVSTSSKSESSSGTPIVWPAWVYCTRYSDRPSSGPRTKKPKKISTEKGTAVTSNEDKRPRTAFSGPQLARLKHEFSENRYLTEKRRQQLSSELGLNEAQIKIWFQNKRAKIKKTSGSKNPLALQLMAQGLYNHSTVPLTKEEEELQELQRAHNSL